MSQSFTFEPATGEIYYQGKLIGKLNSIEGRILVALIKSSGEILERDQLLGIAWPNKNVTPNSLNVAIKKIRSHFHPFISDEIIITYFKKGFSWNQKYQVDIIENKLFTEDITACDVSPQSISEYKSNRVVIPQDLEVKPENKTINRRLGSIKNFLLLYLPGKCFFYYATCIALVLMILIHIIFYMTQLTFINCQTINKSNFCGYGPIKSTMLPDGLPSGEYIYVSSHKNGLKYVEIQ